jgi:hypothetical protein
MGIATRPRLEQGFGRLGNGRAAPRRPSPHHPNTRGAISVPIPAGTSIPSTYQMLRKGAASSGQWRVQAAAKASRVMRSSFHGFTRIFAARALRPRCTATLTADSNMPLSRAASATDSPSIFTCTMGRRCFSGSAASSLARLGAVSVGGGRSALQSAARLGKETSSTTQPTSVLNGPWTSPGGRLA